METSTASRQPMAGRVLSAGEFTVRWSSPASVHRYHADNPDGCPDTVVVFDGAILNREEVRRGIERSKGICLREAGDAELLAWLYRERGPAAVRLINGHFSAVIWNPSERVLVSLVDRIGGFHGIYYCRQGDRFIFSETLPGLLNFMDVTPEIDPISLRELMVTGYILPPFTLAEGIRKVMPGNGLMVDIHRVMTEFPVDPLTVTEAVGRPMDLDELDELLSRAIARTDDGAARQAHLLSGGIDSSLLVAMASEARRESLETFSGAFPGSPLDESGTARMVAERFGTHAHYVDLGRPEFLDDLPSMVWHLDEPMWDFSVIPTYHIFRHVKAYCSTVVSGDGPDHLFGRYSGLAAKRMLAPLTPAVALAARCLRSDLAAQLCRCNRLSLLDAYRLIFSAPAWGQENGGSREQIFHPRLRGLTRPEPGLSALWKPVREGFQGLFDQAVLLDMQIDGAFGVFAKVGKMARAHGLTVMEPYLDREFVDGILNQPVATRARASFIGHLFSKTRGKYLLKYGLAAEYLPEAVVRKQKGGFTPPLATWLRDRVAATPVGDLLCRHLRESDFFEEAYVQRILGEHRAGIRDWTSIIYLLLTTDQWVRMFIEGRSPGAPEWRLSDIYPGWPRRGAEPAFVDE